MKISRCNLFLGISKRKLSHAEFSGYFRMEIACCCLFPGNFNKPSDGKTLVNAMCGTVCRPAKCALMRGNLSRGSKRAGSHYILEFPFFVPVLHHGDFFQREFMAQFLGESVVGEFEERSIVVAVVAIAVRKVHI